MIKRQRVLGVITARGGSKGLPGKNIRDLCGKPLVAWSIEAAKASTYLDRLVVTTDSEEIAKVAKQYGAEVPFLRPPELATDTATSFAAIDHLLGELEKTGDLYDIVALIEPTSPLRETADIDKALEEMLAAGADSVVSVCLAESIHPAFMCRMGSRGRLEATEPGGIKNIRRQDLEPV
ncbi:MAG: NTP transferase domain-containing protein, partial [Deltaproteobacteria bacterium]|nr:NTP transferase domain-containing protein [Deltaproteobacteria bacterium]